jgi:thiamine biosynthesis lipoprotein
MIALWFQHPHSPAVRVSLFFPLLLVLLSGCQLFNPESKWQRFEYVEPEMGVDFHLKFYAPSRSRADRVAKVVYARVEELNGIFSDYEPNSELNRLCKGYGRPMKVSDELFDVLSRSQELLIRTRGAFDVTAGSSVRFWRKVRKQRKMLSLEELRETRSRVGFQKIKLNAKQNAITLTAPGMQLDLGGIAKGYAVDEAIRILKRNGINRAFVAASGDMLASEAPLGKPGWKVEVRNVDQFGNIYPRAIHLRNQALSTSGDTEQFVEIDGRRFSHIVDPRTGIGLTSRIQVTVISGSSTVSDSHATAICVLGKQQGLQFAERRKLQVLVMEMAGATPRVTTSSHWKGW